MNFKSRRFVILEKISFQMRKITLIAVLIALALMPLKALGEVSAAQILGSVEKSLFSTPSAEIFFTITSDGASTQGSAKIQGPMFTFTTPRLMAWYDGTTQWAFQTSTGEVNISEPTADEIMAMNPFGILGQPHTYYNIRRLKSPAGLYLVRLDPKAKGTGIDHIDLCCNSRDYMPVRLTVTFDDARTLDLTVDRIVHGNQLPAASFRYDSKLYPAKEIIDLR